MPLKEELKQLVRDAGADYVGIGPVQRWDQAPDLHRPQDFMPETKSVIVIGIKLPLGMVRANRIAMEKTRRHPGEKIRHSIFSYMLYGYNMINDQLDDIGVLVEEFLEKKTNGQAKVFLLPASVPRDEYLMMGLMSNRHSAVAAGLADFGWNGLALTPEAGPRVRWMPILIDLDLEPDPLYSGPPLCDRSKCRVCIAVCPLNALPEKDHWELVIENKIYVYGKLNRPLCRCGVTGLAAGSAGRLQANIPETVSTVEDWRAQILKDDKWNRLERIAAMCGRCMTQCPVGMRPVDMMEFNEEE